MPSQPIFEHEVDFDTERAPEILRGVPAAAGIVALFGHSSNDRPFLMHSANLRRRLQRLLGPPDPNSKRLNLREVAGSVRYRLTGSRFEQIFTYYHHAKQLFPKRYQSMLRLRPPAVLTIPLFG